MALGLSLRCDPRPIAKGVTSKTEAQLSKMSVTHPYRIGEYAGALEIGERHGFRILNELMNWSSSDARALISKFVRSYPDHGYIIDYDELVQSIGIHRQKRWIPID